MGGRRSALKNPGRRQKQRARADGNQPSLVRRAVLAGNDLQQLRVIQQPIDTIAAGDQQIVLCPVIRQRPVGHHPQPVGGAHGPAIEGEISLAIGRLRAPPGIVKGLRRAGDIHQVDVVEDKNIDGSWKSGFGHF